MNKLRHASLKLVEIESVEFEVESGMVCIVTNPGDDFYPVFAAVQTDKNGNETVVELFIRFDPRALGLFAENTGRRSSAA